MRHQPHLAVVDQQMMAGLDRGEDFRVRKVHALGVAGLGVVVEHESRTRQNIRASAGERVEPELRPLQIDENADRPAVACLDCADRTHQLAHARLRRMAHVDAKDVGAGHEQPLDHGRIGRSRAQRGDDLGAALAFHRAGAPGRVCAGCCKGGTPGRVCGSIGGTAGTVWPFSVSCSVQFFCSMVSTSKNPVRS